MNLSYSLLSMIAVCTFDLKQDTHRISLNIITSRVADSIFEWRHRESNSNLSAYRQKLSPFELYLQMAILCEGLSPSLNLDWISIQQYGTIFPYSIVRHDFDVRGLRKADFAVFCSSSHRTRSNKMFCCL